MTNSLPALRELGGDLIQVSTVRRLAALALPFLCCAAYFFFAAMGWWAPAVVA